MPIGEFELHPYLSEFEIFENKNNLLKYCKLIVGTFPIYDITFSFPIAQDGIDIRSKALQNQRPMKFFYGSTKNDFWKLFANCFGTPMPTNPQQAIQLLETNNFLMTDIIKACERNDYSSLDEDLKNIQFNCLQIKRFLNECKNLQLIYFTSITAKDWFCTCINLQFNHSKDEVVQINGSFYRLIILIPPMFFGLQLIGNFFEILPLNQEEQNLRNNSKVHAPQYRQRYYCHYLTLPCAEKNIKKN